MLHSPAEFNLELQQRGTWEIKLWRCYSHVTQAQGPFGKELGGGDARPIPRNCLCGSARRRPPLCRSHAFSDHAGEGCSPCKAGQVDTRAQQRPPQGPLRSPAGCVDVAAALTVCSPSQKQKMCPAHLGPLFPLRHMPAHSEDAQKKQWLWVRKIRWHKDFQRGNKECEVEVSISVVHPG